MIYSPQEKSFYLQESEYMENLKTCRTFVFQIPGEPIPMRYPSAADAKFWNSTKQKQLQYKLCILNQFEKQVLSQKGETLKIDNEPSPIEGSVQLILHFFLAPKPFKDLPKLDKKPHIEAPRLVDLERFVENVLAHMVITQTCKVTKVIADKIYDKEPRTIIKLKVFPNG